MNRLADELLDIARKVESEAHLAARPGQLDRLDAIASRLRALAGLPTEEEVTDAASPLEDQTMECERCGDICDDDDVLCQCCQDYNDSRVVI